MRSIDRQIDDLSRQRRTMHYTLRDVIRPNPRLTEPGPHRRFMDDVWRWYAISIGVGVRRLVDKNRGTRSLRVFLESIRKNPDALSVDSLATLFVGASRPDLIEQIAPVAGDDPSRIDVRVIYADLAKLDKVSPVTAWVDNYVAHGRHFADAEAEHEARLLVPTYQQLEDALALIECVALKYAKVFLGRRVPYDVAEVDANLWLRIFDFPWRPPPLP